MAAAVARIAAITERAIMVHLSTSLYSKRAVTVAIVAIITVIKESPLLGSGPSGKGAALGVAIRQNPSGHPRWMSASLTWIHLR